MILKRLKLETPIGAYTNCYIIADEKKNEAMVIDPAAEPDKIIQTLKLLGVTTKYIYITHCHADHIGGLDRLRQETGAKVLTHRIEAENLQNPEVNLCSLLGITNVELGIDARVDDSDKLHIRLFRI